MSSREFSEWLAYDRLNPIGPERADWRAAMTAWVMACAHSGAGKMPQFRDFDFMSNYSEPEQKTDEQIRMKMKAYVAMHNEAIKGKR